MQHRTTLRYTERLVAQAVRAFWRKTIGLGLMFAVPLMVAFLVWLLVGGDRSWVVGLTAAVILLGIGMPVAVYVVHYRNSMGKFREMAQPVAEFVADDDMVTLSSDRGTTSLKWNAVTEVWRFESLWLLLFSKSQFVTLPLQDVPAPMQAFILDRVKASGGKISV
jgi:riboflavin transporter FmnP